MQDQTAQPLGPLLGRSCSPPHQALPHSAPTMRAASLQSKGRLYPLGGPHGTQCVLVYSSMKIVSVVSGTPPPTIIVSGLWTPVKGPQAQIGRERVQSAAYRTNHVTFQKVHHCGGVSQTSGCPMQTKVSEILINHVAWTDRTSPKVNISLNVPCVYRSTGSAPNPDNRNFPYLCVSATDYFPQMTLS
jgi:hypothetical protein